MITRNDTNVPVMISSWNKCEIFFNRGRGLAPKLCVLGLVKAEPTGLMKAVEEELLGISIATEVNALLLNDELLV